MKCGHCVPGSLILFDLHLVGSSLLCGHGATLHRGNNTHDARAPLLTIAEVEPAVSLWPLPAQVQRMLGVWESNKYLEPNYIKVAQDVSALCESRIPYVEFVRVPPAALALGLSLVNVNESLSFFVLNPWLEYNGIHSFSTGIMMLSERQRSCSHLRPDWMGAHPRLVSLISSHSCLCMYHKALQQQHEFNPPAMAPAAHAHGRRRSPPSSSAPGSTPSPSGTQLPVAPAASTPDSCHPASLLRTGTGPGMVPTLSLFPGSPQCLLILSTG